MTVSIGSSPPEHGYRALAIGGSAGSLPVLVELLESLAPDTRLAVVVCLHTAASDMDDLCAVLARHCAIPVVEARERDAVRPGRVHVAAGGYHLLVERSLAFSLCAGERVHYVRPSIDVLFETMAEAYGQHLIGILLSGANADGASGLRYIADFNGLTMVQSPGSATAPQMPESALALFSPTRVGEPEQLGAAVAEFSRPQQQL